MPGFFGCAAAGSLEEADDEGSAEDDDMAVVDDEETVADDGGSAVDDAGSAVDDFIDSSPHAAVNSIIIMQIKVSKQILGIKGKLSTDYTAICSRRMTSSWHWRFMSTNTAL